MKFLKILLLWGLPHFVLANGTQSLSQLLLNLKTFQANFSQQVYAPNGEDPDKLSGEVLIKKPGKFSWRVKQPFEQLLIADGNSLWQYDVDLEQVVVRNIDQSMGATPVELLTGSVIDLTTQFDVKTSINNEGSRAKTVYHLVPKQQTQFQFLELTFEKAQLTELTLVDSLDQKTQVKFFNTRVNQIISDENFIFSLPKGVEFIDSRISTDESIDNHLPAKSTSTKPIK